MLAKAELVGGEPGVYFCCPGLHASHHINRMRHARRPQRRHCPLRVVAPPAHNIQRWLRLPGLFLCRAAGAVAAGAGSLGQALLDGLQVAVKVLVGRVQRPCG